MHAAVAIGQSASEPLTGLVVRDEPGPVVPDGWEIVDLRAASLNPHDLWTLRGVGHPADRIPMILGCDGAGVARDGRRMALLGVIGDPGAAGGDETLDPKRSLLSERYPGTFAERIAVPSRNLLDIPDALTFEQAACLPVAFGTAYRMLVTRAGVRAGDTVLVQGASGGVSSAAIWIAKALGATVYATARTQAKREFATRLGADAVLEDGARVPSKVDVVVDTIGRATFPHSLRSLRPGGTLVTCGATTGSTDAELQRVFYLQLRIIGSTICTRDELASVIDLVSTHGFPDEILDHTVGLTDIVDGFADLDSGNHLGKIAVDLTR